MLNAEESSDSETENDKYDTDELRNIDEQKNSRYERPPVNVVTAKSIFTPQLLTSLKKIDVCRIPYIVTVNIQ